METKNLGKHLTGFCLHAFKTSDTRLDIYWLHL